MNTCKSCGHNCHCGDECEECVNDVCVRCTCEETVNTKEMIWT